MSLKTVVEDIRDEARARAEEIRETAEREANSIIAEAESEAESIVEKRIREVERETEQEREQQVSSAKLEAKQDRLATKRDILDAVRVSVEEELATLSGDRREKLTKDLLVDAVQEFEPAHPIDIYGRESDETLLEELIGDLEREVHVRGHRDCLGGVIAESSESRIRVDNTFDAVLDEIWSDSLKDASEKLFE